MTTEPQSGLTYWPAGALQQDLLFNALLLYFSASGHKAKVLDKDLSAPPSLNNTTDVGKAYIVAGSPTGAWSGKANQVAYWTGPTGWQFFIPTEGDQVAVLDEDADYRYSGSAWAGAAGSVSSVQGHSGAVVLTANELAKPVAVLDSTSGVVNIDCSLGDHFVWTIDENITSITFSNLPASGFAQSIFIRAKQDGTGGRTVNLPASFKAIDGSDTSFQLGANDYTLLVITTFDQGTRWEYSMKAGAA